MNRELVLTRKGSGRKIHAAAFGVIRNLVMSTKQLILDEIRKAEIRIPEYEVPDLPGQKDFPEVPEWHSFERSVWKSGEDIRVLLQKSSKLRSDFEIQKSILSICKNQNAKRGRQSFVLLLGSPKCASLAGTVVELLCDSDISGHVISVLLKMKVPGYTNQIEPFASHEVAWIRNKAKSYMQKSGRL